MTNTETNETKPSAEYTKAERAYRRALKAELAHEATLYSGKPTERQLAKFQRLSDATNAALRIFTALSH